MNKRILAMALALAAPAMAAMGETARFDRQEPSPDFDWNPKRSSRGRQRSRSSRKRSGNEAYKAQRAANRDRRRRGA